MPEILVDGTEVQDPRLGRIVQFDEMSRSFPIRESIVAEKIKKPRTFTWRCLDWFDQGQYGACVSYGIGAELASRPSEVQGLTNEFLLEQYFEVQRKDDFAGGEYPGAQPKSGGTSVLAGIKHYRDLNYFGEFRWSFSLDDLVLGIGYFGPAVIGVNWYEGMMDTDQNGFIQVSGGMAGGHCTLLRGVNVKQKYFTGRNSWAKHRGRDGDFKLTFEDMEKLMYQRGEAAFFLNRKKLPKRAA